MKIIDLLNKIANDDKRPEIIKVNTYIWRYDYELDDYMCDEIGHYLMDHYNMLKCLNYEVEIIEEKKIPENNFNYIYSCENEHIMANFENIKTTLKDIIDYLKSKGE